jgi:hypothetical protein
MSEQPDAQCLTSRESNLLTQNRNGLIMKQQSQQHGFSAKTLAADATELLDSRIR